MEDTGKQLQSVFSKTMKESGQILVQSGKQVDQVLTPEQRAIHNEMKTQAVAKENRRALFTFDLKTGKELWQAGVTFEGKEPTNHQNPYCSASAGHRRTASGGLLRHPPAFTVMTSPVKSSGTARSGRSIPGTGAVRRPSSTVDYAT